MSDRKVLESMPPGMVRTLQNVAHVPDGFYHGPMLRGLMNRGLVRHSNNQLQVTWAGQKVLNILEEE